MVIRGAVLHLNNEQPLVADLFEMPVGTDVGLRCTRLRTLDGKRPVFVDDMASIFFFPYLHIRFVEIPPGALRMADRPDSLVDADARSDDGVAAADETASPADEADLEIDEDFLRRIREV